MSKQPFRWIRRRIPFLGETATKQSLPDGGQVTADVSSTADGAVAGTEPTADSATLDVPNEDEEELNIDDDVLIDGMGVPVFIIDTDGAIVAWNHGIEELTGNGDDVAIGCDQPSTVFYSDGRQSRLLADKVLDAPESADRVYDLEIEDRNLSLYAEDEVFTDRWGAERHFHHTAMPLYEGDEFVAVIQTIQDRTEEVKRHDDVAELVDEVQRTLRSLVDGNLSARATFDAEGRVVDDRLLLVVEELNEMAASFERLTGRVDDETRALAESVERATAAAEEIARNVEEQNGLLSEGANEMQTFSASMEEVAATADQVDDAATQARAAATQGLDASSNARDATDAVVDIGDDLVRSVTDLGRRMDDIEEVVEVISDVAEQTNLLALNANIEAARAGDDGDGFAVVAEEVKTLADETRSHTEKITKDIESIQAQTDDTVAAAEESHQRIGHAGEQITEMLSAFEKIADVIDEAANGIGEVSRATDDQAATVEELTATIEDVRERATETEEATTHIVEATDASNDAIEQLAASIRRLRNDGSGAPRASADGSGYVFDSTRFESASNPDHSASASDESRFGSATTRGFDFEADRRTDD